MSKAKKLKKFRQSLCSGTTCSYLQYATLLLWQFLPWCWHSNSPYWFQHISYSTSYENFIMHQHWISSLQPPYYVTTFFVPWGSSASRQYLIADEFLYSYHLSAWQCIDILRRNYTLITLMVLAVSIDCSGGIPTSRSRRSCCTKKVMSRPAIGMCFIQLPMT